MKTDTHKRMALKKLVQAMAILEQAKSQLILMRENEGGSYTDACVLISRTNQAYNDVQSLANQTKNHLTEKI